MRNIYHQQHNTANNFGVENENQQNLEKAQFLDHFTNMNYQKNVLNNTDNGEFYKMDNFPIQSKSNFNDYHQQYQPSPKQLIKQFNQMNSSHIFPNRNASSDNISNCSQTVLEQKQNNHMKYKKIDKFNSNDLQPIITIPNSSFATNSTAGLKYYNCNSQNNDNTNDLIPFIPLSPSSPMLLSSSKGGLTSSEHHLYQDQRQYQQQRILPFNQNKHSPASTFSSSSSILFFNNNANNFDISHDAHDSSQNGDQMMNINYEEDNDNTIMNEYQQQQMANIQPVNGSASRSSSSCSSYSSLGITQESHNLKINCLNPPNQHRGSSLHIRNTFIQQQKSSNGKINFF
jgi:hypothetical protein